MAPPKAKKKQWGKTATGVKVAEIPVMGKVMEKKRAEERKAKPAGALSMQEKMDILDMYEKEPDTNLIAQKFQRSPDSIRKFIWRYQSTTAISRRRIEAGAEELTDRVIELANVDQALEVLDRLDILSKKRDKMAPTTLFQQLIIGKPSTIPGMTATSVDRIPVPTQKMIDDAIDAEVVKTVG